ncbi:inducible metalloproteinase inhibitor protein [Leptinotarsa decemlineata]|uniref:inducible metalloproteinase inhibitor protein n=1 Tax=Leptinotarsa decemlineata TaxID=7539 RepID=UPI003D303E7D
MKFIVGALALTTAYLFVLGHKLPPGGITWINCTRPNEFYDCGSACQTECKTLDEVCPIVNIRCNDDCYCIPGYARDDHGRCIPIKDCPPKEATTKAPCTRPYEEYKCGSACQTECKTLHEVCPVVNKRCHNTCYCIPGYARNDNGRCIPEEECPPKNCNRG